VKKGSKKPQVNKHMASKQTHQRRQKGQIKMKRMKKTTGRNERRVKFYAGANILNVNNKTCAQ